MDTAKNFWVMFLYSSYSIPHDLQRVGIQEWLYGAYEQDLPHAHWCIKFDLAESAIDIDSGTVWA